MFSVRRLTLMLSLAGKVLGKNVVNKPTSIHFVCCAFACVNVSVCVSCSITTSNIVKCQTLYICEKEAARAYSVVRVNETEDRIIIKWKTRYGGAYTHTQTRKQFEANKPNKIKWKKKKVRLQCVRALRAYLLDIVYERKWSFGGWWCLAANNLCFTLFGSTFSWY